MLIPPICLPLTAMQVIALDYLVAAYPLLLLVCFYVLVTAHDRGCRLVVRLWRPFLWCSARMRQQWNIRHSIIDAFATFVLLSYIKFVSVSGELLLSTPVFNIHGSRIGHFMYYDKLWSLWVSKTCRTSSLAVTILVISIVSILLYTHPLPNEVVPSLPQQVSLEQPRSENVHGLFPRILSWQVRWRVGVQVFFCSVSNTLNLSSRRVYIT